MKKKRIIKVLSIVVIPISILALLVILVSEHRVRLAARGKLYDSVATVPHRKVGLVLGTSPISTWNGRRNYYFDHRIKAAANLYNAGKVDWLVVSGGDYRKTENGYDEPIAMRDSLIRQGVDSARIVLDYDGTRTLNSLAKMRDVYRQDSIIIISQKYHNERALYQAKHLGIDAIGYNAHTPGKRTSWWRNRGREVLARVKLFIDITRGLHPEIKESAITDFTETINKGEANCIGYEKLHTAALNFAFKTNKLPYKARPVYGKAVLWGKDLHPIFKAIVPKKYEPFFYDHDYTEIDLGNEYIYVGTSIQDLLSYKYFVKQQK